MKPFALGLLGAAIAVSTAAHASPAYRLESVVALGAPDRWDYLVADPETKRVYVAHGDRLAVVDAASGNITGEVTGITGGTHGTAFAGGHGYTDDGENGRIIAFDPKSLAIIATIAANQDADGMAADPVTGRLFVMEGDPGTITVVDTKANAAIATIKVGEKMEYPMADGDGHILIAGEEKGDLLKIDARRNEIVARWPMPGCDSPHGVAYDRVARRAFLGCANATLMVVNVDDGGIVARLPIGRGSDAIVFDAGRRRVFSSNGRDGTISVYEQQSPDQYVALEPIQTAVSGRTMTVDQASGRLFVAAASTTPSTTAGKRLQIIPGSLRLMIFAPGLSTAGRAATNVQPTP